MRLRLPSSEQAGYKVCSHAHLESVLVVSGSHRDVMDDFLKSDVCKEIVHGGHMTFERFSTLYGAYCRTAGIVSDFKVVDNSELSTTLKQYHMRVLEDADDNVFVVSNNLTYLLSHSGAPISAMTSSGVASSSSSSDTPAKHGQDVPNVACK